MTPEQKFDVIFNLVEALASAMVILFIIIGFLMSITFMPRKAKRLQKKFAFFPVLTSFDQKAIWLKFYFRYQEYGAGVCLGGNVESHYYEDGTVSFSSRQGSFFPSYRTEWVGNNLFSYRKYLRSEGWKSVKQAKILEEERIATMKNIFGDDFFDKKNYF